MYDEADSGIVLCRIWLGNVLSVGRRSFSAAGAREKWQKEGEGQLGTNGGDLGGGASSAHHFYRKLPNLSD
jgi:hypothetical protein